MRRIKVKALAILLAAAMLPFIPSGSADRVKASDWIEAKSTATGKTSVRLSWPNKKNVARWKIRRALQDKNGNTGSFKTIKTLGAGKKSFVVKGLKKNRSYVFEIRGFRKKKGKYVEAYYSEVYDYTGLAKTSWDEYAYSDPYCSPERIDLSMNKSTQGLSVKGYQIYRKKEGTSAYKKIATIKKKSPGVYKDKNVEKGASYQYKFRSYTKYKGKTIYSPFSDVLKRSAVYQKGKFTSRQVKLAKAEVIVNVTSQKYNAKLSLDSIEYDFRIGGGQYSDEYEDEMAPVTLTGWSKDGISWTEAKKNQSVTLKDGESLYLRFKGDGASDLRKGQFLYNEEIRYNGLPSFFRLYLNGDGTAYMNDESIH
ncbi:MAG: fibronectin type III domain-containing protein [Eubacterium sp.]|nr:fibronectin type III domain-containing protein [Eubacterium sp.]